MNEKFKLVKDKTTGRTVLFALKPGGIWVPATDVEARTFFNTNSYLAGPEAEVIPDNDPHGYIKLFNTIMVIVVSGLILSWVGIVLYGLIGGLIRWVNQ